MSEQPKAVDGISAAKRFQLKDMNVTDEDIAALRTNQEADELIGYLKAKNTPPKSEPASAKPPMLKLNANMGQKMTPLPDPEDPDKIVQKKYNASLLDRLDPVSPVQPHGRWNNASRIMLVFDEDHPNGRLF